MEKVKTNKENKAKQKRRNRGDARPYDSIQARLKVELGYTTSRAQIWLEANKKKDGSYSDDQAALAALMTQYDDEAGVPKEHNPGDVFDLAHKAYDVDYKGEHSGRVREEFWILNTLTW